ncbi:DNA helicase PIF1, ATP-dependent [Tanacetum coccineum]
MKEYCAYIIQHRHNQGTTLLRGGRLFQQYLVDTFTVVEEQRLKWKRNNQDTLRVDLYHNLCDAITRGDMSAAGLGKRIVLPRSFIGSPIYMMQNYQDAMAICRAYGNPDLFITFTSNPKWVEISEMLAHIVAQQRFKCMMPDEINDIISAELPSLAEDPEGYKPLLISNSHATELPLAGTKCSDIARFRKSVASSRKGSYPALQLTDELPPGNPKAGKQAWKIFDRIPRSTAPKSKSTPIEQIVFETYPDFTTRQTDESYLKEKEILTPRNDDADAINECMFKKLGGVPMTYNNADEIYKASTDTTDQHHLYPVEFLNTLNFP